MDYLPIGKFFLFEKGENMKRKKRLLALSLALQMLLFSGCGKNVNNSDDGFSEKTLEAGEHLILKVDKDLQFFVGKNEQWGLVAPKGYTIKDYDYDFYSEGNHEFHDYVFVNKEPVKVKNPNNIGTPVNSDSKELSGSGVYKAGEHVIVNVDRSVNLLFGKDGETKELKAPVGYDVVDYDYDKVDTFEYENITYANTSEVKVDDFNDFGIPIEDIKIKSHSDGYYDIGEHKLVTVNRNVNVLWGKNETKRIVPPKGYKVVDYDYDKTDSFEFETITYENIVPIKTKKGNEFGTPLVEVSVSYGKELDVGEHVLVKIDRNVEVLFGFEGTEELVPLDGYEILDYDYDKNEDFEFETTVYVNNKKVLIDDENTFGKVIEKDKTLTLK